jgi:uncharacterized protein YbjQ (UPF0145 family)
MLITTTNDVPGQRIEKVFGEVFGLTVRSRNVGSQLGAAFKSLAGRCGGDRRQRGRLHAVTENSDTWSEVCA